MSVKKPKSKLAPALNKSDLKFARSLTNFAGYTPRKHLPSGTYTGESFANVRAGSLDPARPRVRGM